MRALRQAASAPGPAICSRSRAPRRTSGEASPKSATSDGRTGPSSSRVPTCPLAPRARPATAGPRHHVSAGADAARSTSARSSAGRCRAATTDAACSMTLWRPGEDGVVVSAVMRSNRASVRSDPALSAAMRVHGSSMPCRSNRSRASATCGESRNPSAARTLNRTRGSLSPVIPRSADANAGEALNRGSARRIAFSRMPGTGSTERCRHEPIVQRPESIERPQRMQSAVR